MNHKSFRVVFQAHSDSGLGPFSLPVLISLNNVNIKRLLIVLQIFIIESKLHLKKYQYSVTMLTEPSGSNYSNIGIVPDMAMGICP